MQFPPGICAAVARQRSLFGFWRALRELTSTFWRICWNRCLSHRKAPFGDLDYDWEHRNEHHAVECQLPSAVTGPFSGTPLLCQRNRGCTEQIMQALVPIRFQDLTCIDLGSGKGRALLMAAPYGFKRIIGVKFMPEWQVKRAGEYCQVCRGKPIRSAMQSVCMDARDFEFPAEPLVLSFQSVSRASVCRGHGETKK